MNLYGSKPQEQAMQKLIHDTNSALSRMNDNIKRIGEWLKTTKQADSHPYVYVEYLKTIREDVRKAIDSYYEKFNKDFPDNT
jgi:hypothetical protein